MKFNVDAWARRKLIPDWVKGNSYKVQEVTGSRVLLEGILSWISKGDIELLPDSTTVPDKQPEATHVVQYGETLSSIAYQYGTDYQTLAALNGLTNPNLIYPGQVLKVNGSATSNVYTVKYGDNLSHCNQTRHDIPSFSCIKRISKSQLDLSWSNIKLLSKSYLIVRGRDFLFIQYILHVYSLAFLFL